MIEGLSKPKGAEISRPKENAFVFSEARQVGPRLERRRAVKERIKRSLEDGTFRLTPILNESEPYRTLALEVLTNTVEGQYRGRGEFENLPVRLKNRQSYKLANAEDARFSVTAKDFMVKTGHHVVRTLGETECFANDFQTWPTGEVVEVPISQAIPLLHKHGWYVDAHLPVERRKRYRPIVELGPEDVPVDPKGNAEEA